MRESDGSIERDGPCLHRLVHAIVNVAQERHRHCSGEHRLRRMRVSLRRALPKGHAAVPPPYPLAPASENFAFLATATHMLAFPT
jgi:hypothetical protein